MISRFRIYPSFIILSLFICSSAFAANTAHDWLKKINQAARHLEYEGTFVYQHDDQLEAMHIYHKVQNGSVKERLVSLNGAPREIIRDAHEVRCYWPDKNSVTVEYHKAGGKGFPAILPDNLEDLNAYYTMQMGDVERIVGRQAQLIVINPVDEYRYGYHLWADKDTGLLLKADLVDAKGNVLEQFMFTQLSIGKNIPDSALAPGMPDKDMIWYRENDSPRDASGKPGWKATSLPKGFYLSLHVMRYLPMRKQPVEHLVYTDGLAAVSVFIEKQAKGAKPFMLGSTRMGALHAMGVRVDDYQITAVGEVPAETVALIGGSVVPSR